MRLGGEDRASGQQMATFIYRCPNTGLNVQGWSAEDVSDEPESYEAMTCTACGQLHFVNRATGKVLGDDGDSA
jgi:hypothetical protein